MHPAAIEAMTAVLATVGNASSLHGTGRVARRRMEEAREALALVLGARPSEVIFTAGGTESDNLAVKGIFWARRDAEPRRRRIVTTPVEHHAVLDAVEWLVEHEGAEVSWLPVQPDGSVTSAALRDILQRNDDVALVSVMWANNEVGTLQPIAEIAGLGREHGIPVVQNVPLARAIFRTIEVDQEISPDLYLAMAEVLAYVYRVSQRVR